MLVAMSRHMAVALALIAAVGCGGGGTSGSPAGCPTNFKIGTEHHANPACFPAMLEAVMTGQHISYDHAIGETQAPSICRRLEADGEPKLTQLAVLADWQTGTLPAPTSSKTDQATFLVAAVAVYCPQHYAELR
jgi:hypothetical protein